MGLPFFRHHYDAQGQQQTQDLPADNGYRDRGPLLGTRADADGHWEQSVQRRQICCVKNLVPEEHLYVSRRFSSG